MSIEEGHNDFNIYYMNFSKVYEIAMMINNQIVKSYQKEKGGKTENTYSLDSLLETKGKVDFLSSIKASMTSKYAEKITTNAKVIESIEVQTTKSILLRRIIGHCRTVDVLSKLKEGDLVKIDQVKMDLLDEESLRQFLILKRDALKGFRVEGMDLNNIINSMLQDYSYILVGSIKGAEKSLVLKIPMEAKAEFENKYNIDDILIGHVSIVGIYKGPVVTREITSNTLSYFQEKGEDPRNDVPNRIIKSNQEIICVKNKRRKENEDIYQFIDTIAIIQDVRFKKTEAKRIRWWNKLGIWLSAIGR